MARKEGIVAFDIDGVLADFTSAFTHKALLIGITNREWSGYEQKKWNFDFHVDPVWAAVDDDPSFWFNMETLTTVDERTQMGALAARRHIMYATNRRGAEEQTLRWLEAYGFPEGPVFFDCDKVVLYTALSDQLIGAIDDKPETLAAAYAIDLPMWRRAWPYNSDAQGVPFVHNLGEFLDVVEA